VYLIYKLYLVMAGRTLKEGLSGTADKFSQKSGNITSSPQEKRFIIEKQPRHFRKSKDTTVHMTGLIILAKSTCAQRPELSDFLRIRIIPEILRIIYMNEMTTDLIFF